MIKYGKSSFRQTEIITSLNIKTESNKQNIPFPGGEVPDRFREGVGITRKN
jgi:cytochrome c-type biogenesis protein CcmE